MFIFIGWTPLMFAAKYGHLSIVEFLVTHGADLNVKNIVGKFLILCFYCVETICFLLFMKIYLHQNEKIHLVIKIITTNQTQR